MWKCYDRRPEGQAVVYREQPVHNLPYDYAEM